MLEFPLKYAGSKETASLSKRFLLLRLNAIVTIVTMMIRRTTPTIEKTTLVRVLFCRKPLLLLSAV